ncbi:MAG: SdrD B-like domain-containing protein, partial [Ilumatobacteraceae bacterium]
MNRLQARRWAGAGALAMLAISVVVASSTPVRAAAPSIAGTVWNDVDNNGVVNISALPRPDTPFSAVTVQVVNTADNSVVATPTVVNGAWSAEDLATGTYIVRVTSTSNSHTISTFSNVDNGTPRIGGQPLNGQSGNIVLGASTAATISTLVRPDWITSLGVVQQNSMDAIFTGSAPFDAGCPGPGLDCAAQDAVVRSADNVTFNWSVSASSFNNQAPTVSDVVVEQTIVPATGAEIEFGAIPARCTPSGGGGTPPPASVIVNNPDGSITLRFNLGTW